MKSFFSVLAFTMAILFLSMPASAGISIKQICVSERGKPTGIILSEDLTTRNPSNPGKENISISTLVNGRGILEWVKIHLKDNVLRLETGGQLKIEQLESPFSIRNDRFGRIIDLDGTEFVFGKEGERMERIGPLTISYDSSESKITGIGGLEIKYDSFGPKVKSVGDIGFVFDKSGIRLIKAGPVDFSYDPSGLKVTKIGSLLFEYNALGLKINRIKGSIAGMKLIMTGEKEPCREFPF